MVRSRHSSTRASIVFAVGLLLLASSVSVLQASQDTAAGGSLPWTSLCVSANRNFPWLSILSYENTCHLKLCLSELYQNKTKFKQPWSD